MEVVPQLMIRAKLNFELQHKAYASRALARLVIWLVMKKFKHLGKSDRLEIGILLDKGYSDQEIASVLGRNRSTIYRERTRNQVNSNYSPVKAQHKAYVRRKYSKYQSMCIVEDMKLREFIETKLLDDDWSPEQIAGRLASKAGLRPVSAPTIYKYIRSPYGRQLEYELDLAKQKRLASKKKHQRKVTSLENRIFIDERPEAVDDRKQFGHWEGDFIVSGKQYGNTSLLVLHERVSRYTLIARVVSRTVAEVEDVLADALKFIGNFKSLTLDNDIAFQRHDELSQLIQAPIFFCQPYHSWEKGGVENINRLIRRYIPKGCDIAQYEQREIWDIQHKLNNMPRKVLGFKTAKEVYLSHQKEAQNA